MVIDRAARLCSTDTNVHGLIDEVTKLFATCLGNCDSISEADGGARYAVRLLEDPIACSMSILRASRLFRGEQWHAMNLLPRFQWTVHDAR